MLLAKLPLMISLGKPLRDDQKISSSYESGFLEVTIQELNIIKVGFTYAEICIVAH